MRLEVERTRRSVSTLKKQKKIGEIEDLVKGVLFGPKELREKCIKDIVVKTNNDLYSQEFDTKLSGSTLVFVLLFDNKIVCGNVGDSRAIIASKNELNNSWLTTDLSRDHKPDLPDEKERIINSNGRISPFLNAQGNYVGPIRVWQKDGRYPGLAMSRSLGDSVGKKCGVIEIPEVVEKKLSKDDCIIIIGSDGIWELITSEEAVNIVAPFLSDNSAEAACNKLVEEALIRWKKKNTSIDDITCIVIFINPK